MSSIEQLVERIAVLTREVRTSDEPVDPTLWRAFDTNLHRFLVASIGHHGERVPIEEPGVDVLRELVTRYPNPLPSPLADSPAAREAAAGVRERPSAPIVGLPRRGTLQLVATPDDEPPLTLPSPTDPRPVSRISCAVGALADLVEVLEYQQVPATSDLATNTAHVLAAAAVVARHTLQHGPLTAGDRPLAVGRHAEAGLAAMQPTLESTPARTFRGLPTVTVVDVGDTVLGRAVPTWEAASQAELRLRIPSTDSMRMLLNQSAHIAATLESIVASAEVAAGADDLRENLAEGRKALAAADQAWVPGLTSLVKPSNEFITASRELFLALEETRTRAHQLTQPEREHAAEKLELAMAIVGRRLAAARGFLQPLADGKALYAPARRVEGSPERLTDRLKGRYVPIDYFDIKPLDAAWRSAEVATRPTMSHFVNQAQARVASLC